MRAMGPSSLFLRILSSAFLLTLALPSVSQSAPSTAIQSFQLVSDKSGFLLANNHLFWSDTTGAQWAEITPPPQNTSAISGVFFRPDGNGWALESSATSLSIAHTADKGAHWSTTAIASPFTAAQTFNGHASTFFPDTQHGFLMLGLQSGSAFRLGVLLRTTDGGATWQPAPTPPVGGDLTFTDATHGFMGPGPAGDELFQTSNAGQTWQRVTLPLFSADLKTAASAITLPTFTDATHGALLRTYTTDQGTSVVHYETTDTGLTWTPTAAPIRNSTPAALAIATNGATTAKIAASPSVAGLSRFTSAVGTLTPIRSTFSTNTTGWVLFSGGNCTAEICTQTSALLATLDGGKTYISLGQLPGIDLEPITTAAAPGHATKFSPLLSPSDVHPDSSSVYNTSGVMGFDACSLPTNPQLTDWIASSPYRVVGIYLGGENLSHCTSSATLNSTYVATILTQGWQMIPIWVGPQGVGACSGSCASMSSTPATAMTQGATEADSAIAALNAVGVGQGSPIIYDMEAYTRTVTANVAATSAFIEGWDTELHAKGYIAAVYSSHPEFTDWYPTVVTPAIDTIWFAYFFNTGVACGTECQTVFPTQSSFDISTSYWLNNHRARQTSSGFNSTYGSTTINIDEDWVDAAMVTATPNTLTLSKTSAGGSVASTTISNGYDTTSYTAISCADGCTTASATFAPTDTLTLVATPDSGYTVAWTGCTSTSGTTCTVTVSAATTVTATFTTTTSSNDTLTVTKSGTGSGTVSSSDNTISCGTTCSASYAPATIVTLTATPASGSIFASWTGCTISTGTTCSVTMAAAEAVTATFNTAPTFTAALSATTLSIVDGQNATDALTITPQSGYTGTFNTFTCTGLPTVATCSFNPTTLTATGTTTPLTSTITINTSVIAQVETGPSKIVWAGLLLPSLLLPFALRRRLRNGRTGKLLLLALAIASLGLTQLLTGCGGSSSPATPTGPIFSGTVTVNLTSSSGITSLPIQLTITH
jgi:hypothetical protein